MSLPVHVILPQPHGFDLIAANIRRIGTHSVVCFGAQWLTSVGVPNLSMDVCGLVSARPLLLVDGESIPAFSKYDGVQFGAGLRVHYLGGEGMPNLTYQLGADDVSYGRIFDFPLRALLLSPGSLVGRYGPQQDDGGTVYSFGGEKVYRFSPRSQGGIPAADSIPAEPVSVESGPAFSPESFFERALSRLVFSKGDFRITNDFGAGLQPEIDLKRALQVAVLRFMIWLERAGQNVLGPSRVPLSAIAQESPGAPGPFEVRSWSELNALKRKGLTWTISGERGGELVLQGGGRRMTVAFLPIADTISAIVRGMRVVNISERRELTPDSVRRISAILSDALRI